MFSKKEEVLEKTMEFPEFNSPVACSNCIHFCNGKKIDNPNEIICTAIRAYSVAVEEMKTKYPFIKPFNPEMIAINCKNFTPIVCQNQTTQ